MCALQCLTKGQLQKLRIKSPHCPRLQADDSKFILHHIVIVVVVVPCLRHACIHAGEGFESLNTVIDMSVLRHQSDVQVLPQVGSLRLGACCIGRCILPDHLVLCVLQHHRGFTELSRRRAEHNDYYLRYNTPPDQVHAHACAPVTAGLPVSRQTVQRDAGTSYCNTCSS